MAKSRKAVIKHQDAGQLLSLIPESKYLSLAEAYSADKWVPKLKSHVLFKLIFYSLLSSDALSLRVMAENHQTPWFKVVAQHSIDKLAHHSIRARLMTVPVSYFEDLYDHVYAQLSKHYSTRQLKQYHIKRYDSTMVATYAHLLDGMRVGNTSRHKRQIKFTTELRDDLLIQMSFHSDQGHLSEEVALKEAILTGDHKPTDIIVFDRGLKKRQTFEDFDKESLQFVTRADENLRYEVLEACSNPKDSDTETFKFIQDSKVLLFGKGRKKYSTPFRLIEAIRIADETRLLFLTNIFTLKPIEIAQIYTARWDIETLFRFMKQEMNLTHLVCNQANAIQVMLKCTLIAAMLILLYRKVNQIHSYKLAKIRFFNELQVAATLDFLELDDGPAKLKRNMKSFLKRE